MRSRTAAGAFTACYADDASVVLPGGVLHRSRDEIRDYMAAGFAGPLKGTVGEDKPEVFRRVGPGAFAAARQACFSGRALRTGPGTGHFGRNTDG